MTTKETNKQQVSRSISGGDNQTVISVDTRWGVIDAVERISYQLVRELFTWWSEAQDKYKTDEYGDEIDPLDGLRDLEDPLLEELPLPSLNTVVVYNGKSFRMNSAPCYLAICEASYIIDLVENDNRLSDIIREATIYANGYFSAYDELTNN